MPRKPSSSGLSDDPSIEFVNFLTTRTEEGHIKWNVYLNVIETHLPVAMTAQFLTQSTPLDGRTWRLFLLRDSRRDELIRAFPTTDLTTNPRLICALDALFVVVSKLVRRNPSVD